MVHGGGQSVRTENLTLLGRVNLFLVNTTAAAISASTAEVTTIPLDTAKVRLQIQGQNPHGTPNPYTSMVNCLVRITKEEGATALFKGLVPGIARQCVYGSLRFGFYEPMRNTFYDLIEGGHDYDNSGITVKVLAGLASGAAAMSIAQPTDVIKIKLQAQGKLPAGVQPRYHGFFHAFGTIFKEEGIRGLWRGLSANILRNATYNCVELAVYDQIKQVLLGIGMSDTPKTHCVGAFAAGFAAVLVGSPIDVVKTRLMQGGLDKAGNRIYNGPFDCIIKILKTEHPLAFYQGFWPNFYRVGAWNVVMFLVYEQVKRKIRENTSFQI